MNIKNVLRSGLLFFSLAFMVSCSRDDDGAGTTAETYDTTVSVTDAPIDNANVQGAFVTITNVKINGKALEGFQTTTVDLLAWQNGNVKALGNVALESGTTSSIVIELDNEVAADGSTPGNYIATSAGDKIKLVADSGEIVLTSAAEVLASNDNEIVLDFDLRKMIVLDGEANDSFKFVSGTEMQNSVRAVNAANAGTIKGEVSDANNTAETIVVYAYEKGTYAETETQGSTASGVRFGKAVNSSVVSEVDGSYELHFLEEGEYELHYAAYSENAQGKMEFQSMLQADAALGLGLDVLGLQLNANSTTTVNVVIKGTKN